MTRQPGEPGDPQETVDKIDETLSEATVAAAPFDLSAPTGDGGSPPPLPPGSSGSKGAKVRRTDAAFKRLTQSAGVGLLLLIVAIALFLVLKATHALSVNKGNFFTTEEWNPNDTPPVFGIAALLFGTVVTAVLAMLMAVPVAVGVALYITHYAPRRIAGPIGYLVDLLAAVPSVVYGLWGLVVLVPHMKDLQVFLNTHLHWFPLFGGDNGVGRSVFVASVVLAIMILPIVAAISREVFVQVPSTHKEAALALGATRWEMIRTAVLPFGKPGVISASMLGLGRAMGETIAVALVLPATFNISWHFLSPAGNTIAANVANQFGEANDVGRGALIASGLVLFIVTMLVNLGARAIIARRAEFSGANA